MPEKMDAAGKAESLIEWIRDRVYEAGVQGVVYGLSGGLDSALVGALCQRAFPEDSLAVIMPCYSIEQDLEDARLVADVLGLKTKVVVLDQVYDILRGQLDPVSLDIPSKKKQLILANMKPRLRMIVLYYYASIHKYLVVGGSNKSELTVGYFTKHGDGGSDLIPLGNLVKYQVRELARYLGVPDKIITKPPSAGLWKNQNDEDDFGFTYAMLDRYLLGGEVPEDVKEKIEGMRKGSGHKRRTPPIPDF
jgi:NAD+ synthase